MISGWLKDEMRFKTGILRACHKWAQEYGFEIATVIGKMRVGLAERRYDLRYFQTIGAVGIG